MKKENDLMQKITALCKRRGFVFSSSEIYGGLANSYTYGPYGTELKNNIKKLWWQKFVETRDDMVGLDGPIMLCCAVLAESSGLRASCLSGVVSRKW